MDFMNGIMGRQADMRRRQLAQAMQQGPGAGAMMKGPGINAYGMSEARRMNPGMGPPTMAKPLPMPGAPPPQQMTPQGSPPPLGFGGPAAPTPPTMPNPLAPNFAQDFASAMAAQSQAAPQGQPGAYGQAAAAQGGPMGGLGGGVMGSLGTGAPGIGLPGQPQGTPPPSMMQPQGMGFTGTKAPPAAGIAPPMADRNPFQPPGPPSMAPQPGEDQQGMMLRELSRRFRPRGVMTP